MSALHFDGYGTNGCRHDDAPAVEGGRVVAPVLLFSREGRRQRQRVVIRNPAMMNTNPMSRFQLCQAPTGH